MRKTNERAASGTAQAAASRINVVQGGDIAGGDRSKSTVRIPLAQIEIGAGTQARTRIDNALAEEYAEAMRDGAFFPPVIVFSDGKNTYLADGFHRVEAARRCGFLDIDAIVEQGTARDALWYALGANKAHGLRMSRADVRRAIGLALQEFPNRSSRDIAKQIGCDHKTVEAARRSHEAGGEIPQLHERTGADGKTYQARRGAKKSEDAEEGEPAGADSELEEDDGSENGEGVDLDTGAKEAWPDEAAAESMPVYDVVLRARSISSATKKLASTFGPGAVVSVAKQIHPTSRHARLESASGLVEEARSIVEELADEIESWVESLPENLRGGDKAEQLSECSEGLRAIMAGLEELDFSSIEFPGAFGS